MNESDAVEPTPNSPDAEPQSVQFKVRLADGQSYIVHAKRMGESAGFFVFFDARDVVVCQVARDAVALVGRWAVIEADESD